MCQRKGSVVKSKSWGIKYEYNKKGKSEKKRGAIAFFATE